MSNTTAATVTTADLVALFNLDAYAPVPEPVVETEELVIFAVYGRELVEVWTGFDTVAKACERNVALARAAGFGAEYVLAPATRDRQILATKIGSNGKINNSFLR